VHVNLSPGVICLDKRGQISRRWSQDELVLCEGMRPGECVSPDSHLFPRVSCLQCMAHRERCRHGQQGNRAAPTPRSTPTSTQTALSTSPASESHSEAPVSCVKCQVPVPAPAPAPARIAVKARIAKPRISPRLGLTVAIYHTDELDRAGAKEGARSRRVRVRKHDAWRGVEREGRLAAMRHMPCHVMQCRAMRLVVCKSRTLQVVRGHAGGRGCGAVVCVWWWWVQCR
jgi:hypothetical protein